jgi:CheY-like chemotaxis protein
LSILIIDDDPILIESLRNTLEDEGHRITGADGGQAGIDAFQEAVRKKTPFDIVITDLGMPYVDGRQVIESLRRSMPQTPIILLTGWGQRVLAESSELPQANRLLSKPPRLQELRVAIRELFA